MITDIKEIETYSWTTPYHKEKGVFSIPYYSGITRPEMKFDENFEAFLETYSEWIHDIYFTPPTVEPFVNDSMGMGKNMTDEEKETVLVKLLGYQEKYNIPISATFNDTSVMKTEKELKQFIENFRPLYERGVRNITLAPVIWMLTGEIKKAFPDLYIKNTVLTRVRDGQMFWDHAQAGFDYINIDRELMRNEDALKSVKKAQTKFYEETGKYIPIALLANESCRGKCPVMDEHYHYNQNSHKNDNIPYFGTKISQFTCPYWEKTVPGYILKNANFVPLNSQIDWVMQYVDVFKMHGRATPELMMNSLGLINEFIRDDGIEIPFEPELYTKWLKVIKNCKFQCYDCNLCGEVEASIEKTNHKYLENPTIFH